MVVSEIIVGMIAFGLGYLLGIRSVVKKLKSQLAMAKNMKKNMQGMVNDAKELFDRKD